jgi:hypothetical protein
MKGGYMVSPKGFIRQIVYLPPWMLDLIDYVSMSKLGLSRPEIIRLALDDWLSKKVYHLDLDKQEFFRLKKKAESLGYSSINEMIKEEL